MSRLALVTIVLLGSACTRRQQDFTLFALAVAAEVANASAASEQPSGVAVAAPDPDAYRPTPADLQRAHDVAMELTSIAANDARSDNCDAVVRTSKHVRVIDPVVFTNVFLRDPPIQRCLGLAPEPALTE